MKRLKGVYVYCVVSVLIVVFLVVERWKWMLFFVMFCMCGCGLWCGRFSIGGCVGRVLC